MWRIIKIFLLGGYFYMTIFATLFMLMTAYAGMYHGPDLSFGEVSIKPPSYIEESKGIILIGIIAIPLCFILSVITSTLLAICSYKKKQDVTLKILMQVFWPICTVAACLQCALISLVFTGSVDSVLLGISLLLYYLHFPLLLPDKMAHSVVDIYISVSALVIFSLIVLGNLLFCWWLSQKKLPVKTSDIASV